MYRNTDDKKMFNIKLSKDLWVFVKIRAATEDTSMAAIIERCVEKYKKRLEKKLTNTNTNV